MSVVGMSVNDKIMNWFSFLLQHPCKESGRTDDEEVESK